MSSIKGAEKNGQSHTKVLKLDHYLTPYTNINSNWIKDLSISPETIKTLEENIGDKLLNLGLDGDFLDFTPIAKVTKLKINK